MKFILPLLCWGVVLGGCAGTENAIEESNSCSSITQEEKAKITAAIQHEIDTSAELIAFQTFRDSHEDAIASVSAEALFAKYEWTDGQWELAAATTGITSFVFDAKSTLTVDVAGEVDGSLHLETPDFTYTLSAAAPDGYPIGEVKSASLGEWGVGKGVSAEYFGSREKLFLRFPGGNWEDTRDDEGSTLSLTYAMPGVQAKIWKKKSGSSENIDITLNGTKRCAASEGVLKGMFPDVWKLLELQ